MAVSAHRIMCDENGHLVMRSSLIAFRRLEWSHTEEHLAMEFVKILQDAGTIHKLGTITLDNASNNDTFMEVLTCELAKLGILFDCEGNRIRCFPHVINLLVKAGLCHLTVLTAEDAVDNGIALTHPINSSAELLADPLYMEALQKDVVPMARKLVVVCRASGQRRDDFEKAIERGKEFCEDYEKSQTVAPMAKWYDLEALPEQQPEGRDAWVPPWEQDKWADFFE